MSEVVVVWLLFAVLGLWFVCCVLCDIVFFFFFQAEGGIRDLVRSSGLGDVYKRKVREGYYPSCSLTNLRIEMNKFNSVPAVTGVSRYVTLL